MRVWRVAQNAEGVCGEFLGNAAGKCGANGVLALGASADNGQTRLELPGQNRNPIRQAQGRLSAGGSGQALGTRRVGQV